MFVLKTVLENLDGVQEALHELYEEKDGKFILKVEGIEDHPSVAALKNGHANAKRERNEAKTKIADLERKLAKFEGLPDDFDPDEYERVKAELDELKANPNPKEQEIEQRIEAKWSAKFEQQKTKSEKEIKRLTDQVAERDQRLAKIDTEFKSNLIDSELSKALDEAGVTKPAFRRAATAILRSDIEVVEEDGVRHVRMKADLGGDPVNKYVPGVWAQSDEGKTFVEPSSGGGAGGSKGNGIGVTNNPWSKEHWDVGAQTKLFKQDPNKARRLAKEHGHNLG